MQIIITYFKKNTIMNRLITLIVTLTLATSAVEQNFCGSWNVLLNI
jgi:hypothetical protein